MSKELKRLQKARWSGPMKDDELYNAAIDVAIDRLIGCSEHSSASEQRLFDILDERLADDRS